MNEAEITKFIFREARLMDEHRYDEWLALWAKDALYWVPTNHDAEAPGREVSIICDQRQRLEDRIARLKSGDVLAQDPQPRIRRVVSNLEIDIAAREIAEVSSNFILVQAKGFDQIIWCGRSFHSLRWETGELRIARKKVLLVNSEQEMPALQFLI